MCHFLPKLYKKIALFGGFRGGVKNRLFFGFGGGFSIFGRFGGGSGAFLGDFLVPGAIFCQFLVSGGGFRANFWFREGGRPSFSGGTVGNKNRSALGEWMILAYII
jgi:hypothetical protein